MFDLKKSELREKLLVYYFTNITVEHYLRELAGILGVDPTNLSRELHRLEKQGIFLSEKKGNQKYFKLNKNNNIFKELKSIILKTSGLVGSLKESFSEVDKIKLAVLYGSFAKGSEDEMSDVDVILVGDIDWEIVSEAVDKLEKRLQREINIKVYSLQDFEKEKKKSAFLKKVLSDKHIILVDRL